MTKITHHYDSFVEYRKHRQKMERNGWKATDITGHSVKNGLFGKFLRQEYRMKIVATYEKDHTTAEDLGQAIR